MEATTQILGKLTLQGNITNALKGFQIDLYDTDHQIGWLAGTKVKSNGEFEFYVNETTATTDYSFQISNKGSIFFTVERERGLDLYELDMRLSIYDAIVQSSKTEWDEQNEYFIVKGYI
jgi:hypothetical protein